MRPKAETPQLPAELAAETKGSLAMGMEIFGTSAPDLARLLNEHPATVAAWCSRTKLNQVPMWILGHRRLPPGLRGFLLSTLNAAAGERRPLAAHSAESQAKVVVKRLAHLIGALADALDDAEITPAEARELLPKLEKDIEAIGALRDRLLGVVASEASPSVRGCA